MKRMFPSLAAFGVCVAALALGVFLPGWMTRGAEKDDLYQRFSMEPVSLTSKADDPGPADDDRAGQVLDDMIRYRNAQDFIPLEWLKPGASLFSFWNTLLERLEALGWLHGERSTTSTLAFLRQGGSSYLIGWNITCVYQFSYPLAGGTQTGWTTVNAHVSENGALLALELFTDQFSNELEDSASPEGSVFGMTPPEAARQLAALFAELDGLPIPKVTGDNETFLLRFAPEGREPVEFTLFTGKNLLVFNS